MDVVGRHLLLSWHLARDRDRRPLVNLVMLRERRRMLQWDSAAFGWNSLAPFDGANH